jgi:hypothetical protein
MNIALVDAFDLPSWVGTERVVWSADDDLEGSPLVVGTLRGPAGNSHPLDLLAVDSAFPRPVCGDRERSAAHQAWQYGEVVILGIDSRIAAGVPGTRFNADLVCETLRRVARSVGAPSSNFTVSITL